MDDTVEKKKRPKTLTAEGKRCGICREIKPVSEFTRASRKRKHPYHSQCRVCENAYCRARYDPERNRQKYLRAQEKLKQDPVRYALRKERKKQYPHKRSQSKRYLTLLEQQGGVCAICGKPETLKDQFGNVRSLALDHNHQTGHIRGLLCMRCNTDLARLEDETFVNAAKTYLDSHAK